MSNYSKIKTFLCALLACVMLGMVGCSSCGSEPLSGVDAKGGYTDLYNTAFFDEQAGYPFDFDVLNQFEAVTKLSISNSEKAVELNSFMRYNTTNQSNPTGIISAQYIDVGSGAKKTQLFAYGDSVFYAGTDETVVQQTGLVYTVAFDQNRLKPALTGNRLLDESAMSHFSGVKEGGITRVTATVRADALADLYLIIKHNAQIYSPFDALYSLDFADGSGSIEVEYNRSHLLKRVIRLVATDAVGGSTVFTMTTNYKLSGFSITMPTVS